MIDLKYTTNYNLNKPEASDNYNVEHQNENMDLIDQKLHEVEEATKNINVPVKSVNQKTGDVVLKAEDVGAASIQELALVAQEVTILGHGVDTHLIESAKFQSDYEYKQATVNGRQIRTTKESNTSVVKFKLSADIPSGAVITISFDNGATSKSLKDIDGVDVTSLDKGFVEVIEESSFFTLRPKGGAKIDAIIKEYQIDAGENVSAGSLVEFINNKARLARSEPTLKSSKFSFSLYSTYVASALIDIDKVLVIYSDATQSSRATAVVLTISDNTIQKGQILVFDHAISSYLCIKKVDTNKAIVVWRGMVSDPEWGRAVVLSVTGTTISAGVAVQFDVENPVDLSMDMLTTNKFIVVYRSWNNNKYGTAIILTVSGTTITYGSRTVWNSNSTEYPNVITLSPTSALVVYRDGGNLYGTSKILTISGTSIPSVSSASVFSNTNCLYVSATSLGSNKILVAYCNVSQSQRAECVVLSVNGNTITKGTILVFDAIYFVYYLKVLALSGTKVLACYSVNGLGKSVILDVKDMNVFKGKDFLFSTDQGNGTSNYDLALLPNSTAMLTYRLGNVSGDAIIIGAYKNVQGLALQNGIAGETKKFYDWA